MLKLNNCVMDGDGAKLGPVSTDFTCAVHLIHFDSAVSLRLWVETLTGIRTPKSGQMDWQGQPPVVIYPRTGHTRAAELFRLAKGRGCAVLLVGTAKPDPGQMEALERLCRDHGAVVLHNTLRPLMSGDYQYVWQVKGRRMFFIR